MLFSPGRRCLVKFDDLGENWEALAADDPFWAVLTDPSKRGGAWSVDDVLEHGRTEIDEVVRAVERHGLVVARGSTLDFGCGVGRLTQALAGHFPSVVGVDIAPSMIAKATQINRAGDACRFVLNPRSDLRMFEDGRFDFVYSNIVLQHMAPRLALGYVQEFLRVLAPGGLAVFQVPVPVPGQRIKARAPEPLLRVVRRLRGRSGPVMQMWGIDRDTIETTVTGAGGVVAAADRNDDGGAGFPGWRYFVQRPT